MSRVHVFDHPLIRHKLSYTRDVNTGTKEFRELIDEASMLVAYEVIRGLELQDVDTETSVTRMTAKRLVGKKLAIVPVLRAGLDTTDGILSLVPAARVRHIGLYQGPETLKAVRYFAKLLQSIAEKQIIIVDPMLVTSASTTEAITSLKKRGTKNIRFMCLVTASGGVEKIHEVHPDVDIYIATPDEKLNDKAYITLGLGDAGDKLFGTK